MTFTPEMPREPEDMSPMSRIISCPSFAPVWKDMLFLTTWTVVEYDSVSGVRVKFFAASLHTALTPDIGSNSMSMFLSITPSRIFPEVLTSLATMELS